MSKRSHNPKSNSYYCSATPDKARYLKAAFAWQIGAKRMKLDGKLLYIYKCDSCRGWHLSSKAGPSSIPIETKFSSETEAEVEAKEDSSSDLLRK